MKKKPYLFLSFEGTLTAPKAIESNDHYELYQQWSEIPLLENVSSFILNASKKAHLVLLTELPTTTVKQLIAIQGLQDSFTSIYGNNHSKTFWLGKTILEKKVDLNDAQFLGSSVEDFQSAVYCNIPFYLKKNKANGPHFNVILSRPTPALKVLDRFEYPFS